ncbi:NAD(P)/FAD-dependent oxidoreductase [Paenibacillus sp. KN14-4R]|uniref:NAD(P)/FAD-dependent oxidoreductase n=1 Tax=Paenibacillus sp. KN14-4R TaxID=3445773 RepID=UPI003FA0D15A
MKEVTCIVIGGGFAGIHAVKAIQEAHQKKKNNPHMRIILMDKQSAHLRKVLLFQPATAGEKITVPWKQVIPEGVHFIQGEAKRVDSPNKQLCYRDVEGTEQLIGYDILVVAVGSISRQSKPEQGGIALTNLESAAQIREKWLANLKLATIESNQEERRRLMTVAIAGAGITGIETAAELAHAMKSESASLGLDPTEISVLLLNTKSRLFLEGPEKVGHKLEDYLADCGVTVHNRRKAMCEVNGQLLLSEGDSLPVGLTVWTLGTAPNPMLRDMALPLTSSGKVKIDKSYRVQGMLGVYSIGDCAHIVDPTTGKADHMTCKEAIPQAQRLGLIIDADLSGQHAPFHKGLMDYYAIGLGPGRGLTWARKWGIDIIITGKLAAKIKTYIWNYVSFIR